MLRDREGGGALVLIPLLTRSKLITCFLYFIILPGFYLVTFVITKPGIDRDRKKEYQFQLIIGKIIGCCILSLIINAKAYRPQYISSLGSV